VNKYLAKLAELPWLHVLMFGFVAAALYYFGVFDDGTSMRNRLQETTTHLADSKKKLDETKKAMADAARFESEVKSTTEQFNKLIEYMPENMSQSDLMSMVAKQAAAAGAKVTRVEPVSVVQNQTKIEVYDPVRVNVSLQGNFMQILGFLSNLSQVPRLLSFDKLNLATLGEGAASADLSEAPVLTFEGTLVGYRYNKNNKVGEGPDPVDPNAPPVAGGASTPGAPLAPAAGGASAPQQ
jgi:Tfp pilus assembly protein PilO